mgnify:CR=1 FL=1
MTEVRTPTEEHREQIGAVMRVSLNLSRAFLDERVPTLPLDRMRCAFEGDRVRSAYRTACGSAASSRCLG